MKVNADLHIHSRFSIGVSKNMSLRILAMESKKKGIQLIGTGDCLYPKWRTEVEDLERVDEGTFELEGSRFVLTTEVEDSSRVHHLIIFPSLSKVQEFAEKAARFSKNVKTSGRPNLRLEGEEIAQLAKDADALIGPSHAFTPWTSLYAYHNTMKSCYGDLADYVSFVELGLSADSDYADRIAELERLTFLTNSDAHSPYPRRLAREFNRFELEEINFECLKRAILRIGSNRPVLNVGLPPQEGKYNETACTKCYRHYDLAKAKLKKWRCRCGGLIKKGVRNRVEELADYDLPKHPDHRPRYLYLIPLSEIISKAIGISSPTSKKVFGIWNSLIGRFGDEITVLIDADMDDIRDFTNEEVANAVLMFRDNRIKVIPGGGGQYGKIVLPGSKEWREIKSQVIAQSPTLGKRKKGRQERLLDY